MRRASPVREEIRRAETALIRSTANLESCPSTFGESEIRAVPAQMTLRL